MSRHCSAWFREGFEQSANTRGAGKRLDLFEAGTFYAQAAEDIISVQEG